MLVRDLRRFLEEIDGGTVVSATILTDGLGREFPINFDPKRGKPLIIVEDLDYQGLAEEFEPLSDDLSCIDN